MFYNRYLVRGVYVGVPFPGTTSGSTKVLKNYFVGIDLVHAYHASTSYRHEQLNPTLELWTWKPYSDAKWVGDDKMLLNKY